METSAPSAIAPPLSMEQKLSLAQEAFQRFHTMCFWHMREDLVITAEDLPAIIKGLRQNGSRETYQIAGRLCH
ncbi:MAG: hypothetical protein PHV34_14175 [Verrucomicrobiae bacterium]|nr:hypothetical protein [Verrucomicrobiae bacterium]